MSWITAGSTSLTNGSVNYGTVSLQYDDTSSGSNWSCRLYFTVNSSVTSLSVYFNNLTIAGTNYGQYSVTKNTTTIWTGTLGANQTVGVSWTCPWYSGSKNYSFNASLPARGAAPSGCYVTYHSSTWNSVSFTAGMTATGDANQIHACVITGSSNGAVDSMTNWDIGRWEWNYDGTTSALQC